MRTLAALELACTVLGIDVPQGDLQALGLEESGGVGATLAIGRAKQRNEVLRQFIFSQLNTATYRVLPVLPVAVGAKLPALHADALR
ncbi:hypothetical protein D3C78_1677900 [compost metagenome]